MVYQERHHKEKKIAKAQGLYQKAISLISTIAKLLTEPNPCFDLECENLEASIKKYLSDLNAIPEESGTESDSVAVHIHQHNVRFEVLRRLIADVDTVIGAETIPVETFYRMKLKSINDNWLWIQQADETFAEKRSTLPSTYSVKMVESEEEVERLCLFLETHLDTLYNTRELTS